MSVTTLISEKKTSEKKNEFKLDTTAFLCSKCGKIAKKKCAMCYIHYCSRECQLADWSIHKIECRKEKKQEIKQASKDSDISAEEDAILIGILNNKKLHPIINMALSSSEDDKENIYIGVGGKKFSRSTVLDGVLPCFRVATEICEKEWKTHTVTLLIQAKENNKFSKFMTSGDLFYSVVFNRKNTPRLTKMISL
jgi:hypothetical protein